MMLSSFHSWNDWNTTKDKEMSMHSLIAFRHAQYLVLQRLIQAWPQWREDYTACPAHKVHAIPAIPLTDVGNFVEAISPCNGLVYQP